MSFLKITDPAKRNFIVEEFLNSKRNIQQNYLSEKLGEVGIQQELTKLYKPIINSQSGISRELGAIKELTASTSNALKALPTSISSSLKAIQFPQYPSIEAYEHSDAHDDPVEDVRTLELGNIATKYLQQYASNKKSTDTTFEINAKDGVFYIGNNPIKIQGDDVTVGEKTYVGTPGLWELLTMAKPNKTIYDVNDIENYAKILNETNAIRQSNNPNKPKSSRSDKYREIIKPIWESKVAHGKGVSSTILPADPNALVDMLSLRMASFKAGNTGVRNEIVSISDELLRQGVIDKEAYKKFMLQL